MIVKSLAIMQNFVKFISTQKDMDLKMESVIELMTDNNNTICLYSRE